MEATDLEARRQDAKHEGAELHGGLTRDEGHELYARLDDAGLGVRLITVDPEAFEKGRKALRRHVVEVDPDSIKSPEHLRLLADQAERRAVAVEGQYGRLRFG